MKNIDDSRFNEYNINMTTTPMMQQYNAIKKNHKDAILFFRLGDFYEMFYDDAAVASKELSLTLTGRGKDTNRIPMCGIPFHAAENYVSKLVKKGYKVAICEQVESANESKGPTKRAVVRIVTPGTAQLDPVLTETDTNYLAAICKVKQSYGIAYLELSTGEFKCDVLTTFESAISELYRIEPKEVMVDDAISEQLPFKHTSPFFPYQQEQATNELLTYFSISDLKIFNIETLSGSYPAIVAILQYIEYTQKGTVAQINRVQPAEFNDTCRFDQGVIDHLDLFANDHGLFAWLNHTKTAMGARHLRQWLRHPLINESQIYQRQRLIIHLMENEPTHQSLTDILSSINDIERLLSKVCSRFHNPRDILALRDALRLLPKLSQWLASVEDVFSNELNVVASFCNENGLVSLINHLNKAILDEVPTHIREGGIFRFGYSNELDELCQSFKDIRDWIKELEPRCREELQIKSLKVGYNKVFGYYIEIPNSQKDKVPDHFIRKQTLTNAERYITPVLKEKETILLTAKDQQTEIEKRLYESLIETIQSHVSEIQAFARVIARLDVVQSLATVANRYQMVVPTISSSHSNTLVMKGLWHPMVAENQRQTFIRNDVSLSDEVSFLMITGPNMAGKSTVMRSVAISVILGQIGSMVPAEYAKFSIVDQLFTRIGASDKLSDGQSTFMVEMIETATICHNATQNSLILLDEIGRGTSTFDGVSIAAAVSEYLVTDIKARTLFATHYHELTALAEKYVNIKNASMQIEEQNNELVFSYKLKLGAAEKSYGVIVAKMAGLPKSVTDKAEQWLKQFETQKESGEIIQLSLFNEVGLS